MGRGNERQKRLLKELADLLRELQSTLLDEHAGGEPEDYEEAGEAETTVGCTIKVLPTQLQIAAAKTAVAHNPQNAPRFDNLGPGAAPMDPLSIAVLTKKYWGPKPRTLTVSFLEPVSKTLRNKILSHMNAWNKTACISFTYVKQQGNVRITREEEGYWSYVGTDILHINPSRPTMCLQDFSEAVPESEYRRVVRHECGHTLGFPHEHMRQALINRLDPQKCYDYFWETQRWPREMVDAQVLTPLEESAILGGPTDETSIMCYQLPGSITKDGNPIKGGIDINDNDYKFAGRIYPKKKGTRRGAEAAEAEVSDEFVSTPLGDGRPEEQMSGFTATPLPMD